MGNFIIKYIGASLGPKSGDLIIKVAILSKWPYYQGGHHIIKVIRF